MRRGGGWTSFLSHTQKLASELALQVLSLLPRTPLTPTLASPPLQPRACMDLIRAAQAWAAGPKAAPPPIPIPAPVVFVLAAGITTSGMLIVHAPVQAG